MQKKTQTRKTKQNQTQNKKKKKIPTLQNKENTKPNKIPFPPSSPRKRTPISSDR